jgi:hypothetical protein
MLVSNKRKKPLKQKLWLRPLRMPSKKQKKLLRSKNQPKKQRELKKAKPEKKLRNDIMIINSFRFKTFIINLLSYYLSARTNRY